MDAPRSHSNLAEQLSSDDTSNVNIECVYKIMNYRIDGMVGDSTTTSATAIDFIQRMLGKIHIAGRHV